MGRSQNIEKITEIKLTLNFIVFENTVIEPPSKKLCYFNMLHLHSKKDGTWLRRKKQENTKTFLFASKITHHSDLERITLELSIKVSLNTTTLIMRTATVNKAKTSYNTCSNALHFHTINWDSPCLLWWPSLHQLKCQQAPVILLTDL